LLTGPAHCLPTAGSVLAFQRSSVLTAANGTDGPATLPLPKPPTAGAWARLFSTHEHVAPRRAPVIDPGDTLFLAPREAVMLTSRS